MARWGAVRRVARMLVATTLVAVATVARVAVALAADPSPTPAGGGDVRTNPAAPGLVGDPLVAIVGVAAVAILAVVVTLVGGRLGANRSGERE